MRVGYRDYAKGLWRDPCPFLRIDPIMCKLSLLGRGAAALSFHFTIGLFTAGVIQTYSFLATYLVMVLGNTGFILLMKESEDHELIRLAESDDLTDTLNRRTFIARTKRCFSRSIPNE